MPTYWTPGSPCALRGIVNQRVWMAKSVIVVKDEPQETILLQLPGAQCAFPEGYWRWKKERDTSRGTRWQEVKDDSFVLREFPWQRNRVLMFLEPVKFYATFLFWEHAADRFDGYYVNFQVPYRRSPCGFDSLDLDLDIVIEPDYQWTWKDENDYQAGIREGGIREEWVRGVEDSKAEVIDRIQRRAHPFDGAWLSWRPDPGWAAPELPKGWNTI
jgi:hypothetical protein